MAANANRPTLDTVLDWLDNQSDAVREAIGDVSTAEGLQRAYDAIETSTDGPKPEVRTKNARDYRLIVMNHSTGSFVEVGTFKGSAGRPATEPAKYSDLQKAVLAARVKHHASMRAGEKVEFLTVLVDSEA